jgi:hypothetical protein
MGVHHNITHESFPTQQRVGQRVRVYFHYNTEHAIGGVIVRDDREEPYETLIRLADGRIVRGAECQYSIVSAEYTDEDFPAVDAASKVNFQELATAFEKKAVGLLAVKDRWGNDRAAIVAINREDGGDTGLVPFAIMVWDDPFEEFTPPPSTIMREGVSGGHQITQNVAVALGDLLPDAAFAALSKLIAAYNATGRGLMIRNVEPAWREQVLKEVILPHLDDIAEQVKQENDPEYLSYAVCAAVTHAANV